MCFNKILRTILSSLFLSIFFSVMSSNALAKRPISNSNGDCISNKELNILAKTALIEIQLIDSSVTLTDVKTVLKAAGECAIIEELNSVLDQYTIDLTASALADANTPPVISGIANSSITEGGFYIFTPTVDDPDSDNRIFSIENLPTWAKFDFKTGTILGVPLASNIGLYENIVITVSDGISSDSLSGISIEVLEVQSRGVESPLLGEIAAYSIYMGTSKDNLSTMIDFNTGADIQTSNTFSAADTYYFYIVARDRDGNNIVLPNTEIGGYRIYIGTSSDNLNPVYNLTEGTDRVYWVNELLAGTYFISITTYDVNGNESSLSNIVQFDVT